MGYLKRLKRYLGSAWKTTANMGMTTGTRIMVFFDAFYCRLRFHVSLDEYFYLRFYNYKNRYRKNFLLEYHQANRYRRVNNSLVTQSKYGFYSRISDLFQREVILVPNCGEEAFLSFIKKHKYVVLKPNMGSLGKGVSTLTYENDEQALRSFREISNEMVCEEYIHQHKALAEMNPHSVNTIRIVSIRNNAQDIEIASATIRSGAREGCFVDNMACGGLVAQIDPETGIISSFGIGHDNQRYVYHPITQKQLIGMNIPHWSEAIALIKSAHSRLHENPIVGWDIAITETGVDIVEANSAPSPSVMQVADLVPKGEKILKILNNKKNHVY